jgi:hypothetical protein
MEGGETMSNREYVDKVINTIRVLDDVIEKCQDPNYSMDRDFIPYLKFARSCVQETLYEDE